MQTAPIGADDNEIQLRLAIRDDVEDSRHLDLAREFEAVGNVRVGNRSCTGTLVKSKDGSLKVLTAAHCFDRDFDNSADVSPSSVLFQTGIGLEGPVASATAIDVPPWDGIGGLDLAVVTLESSAAAELPPPLVVSNENPAGKEVTLAGYGTHGTGMPPFENILDNQRRAATNMADQVFSSGVNEGQIRTDFDHPRDTGFSTMGDSIPTPLEGTSGVGDSGSPMIIDDHVVAVLHGGENPTGAGFSEYGDVSIFAGLFYEPNQAFLRANGVLVTGPGDTTSRVTIEVLAPEGEPFVTSADGHPVSAGSVLRIGALPAGIDVESANLQSVARAWMPFGEVEIGDVGTGPGSFTGTVPGDVTDFSDSKIYWWILETIGGRPASTLSNVTTWGLFSSGKPHWNFPASGSSDTVILHSSDVDQAAGGALVQEGSLVLAQVPEFTLDYETWTLSAFSPGTPASDKRRDADPDRDLIQNGIEWVMGSSPISSSPGSPIHVGTNGEGFVLVEYFRQRFLPAGSEEIQFSHNLENWIRAQPVQTSTEIVDPQREKVRSIFDLGTSAGRQSSIGFWRLTAPDR